MTKQQSIRFPKKLVERIDESRKKLEETRGKAPSFTDWILEAAAEKLEREKKGKN